MLTATQVSNAFHALGLHAPSPGISDAITSIGSVLQAYIDIVELPNVQTIDAPIVRMLELTEGHDPAGNTASAIFQSGLTHLEIARELVGSQDFANNYNHGILLDPKAQVSAGLVDEMFMNGLGHAPTAATEAGFKGMTNAQAFLAFVESPSMTEQHGSEANESMFIQLALTDGIPEGPFIGFSDPSNAWL
jgi:hypothetical protein